jgi:hypothetical protein
MVELKLDRDRYRAGEHGKRGQWVWQPGDDRGGLCSAGAHLVPRNAFQKGLGFHWP